jgi:hypothetical protein
MKYLATFATAVLAALALTAVAGVGAAGAETYLCKATESTCAQANAYGEGTEISAELASGTKSVLTANGNLSIVECASSTVEGKTETAQTPEGKLSGLSFGECNNTVEVLEKGSIQVHWDAEHNGTLTAKGIRLRVEQSFGSLSCDFGGEIKEGLTLTGGSSPKIDVTATVPLLQGTGIIECPSSTVWHAEYEVTKPTPLYVTS